MKKINVLARMRAAFTVFAASTLMIIPGVATGGAVSTSDLDQAKTAKTESFSAHDLMQIRCLAENTYHEAGNQSITGKIAVNNVVMNRVKNHRFPNTPCAVIKQRSKRVCQFSWVCQRGIRVRNQEMYRVSEQVAVRAYRGEVADVTRGSLFYHADYVNPGWKLKRVTKIGAHIFYTYLT